MAGDSPRLLIDASTYIINNNGDMAMLRVLVGRLRARYPGAKIRIITNDASGLTTLDPQIEPIVVGDRRAWHMPVFGLIPRVLGQEAESKPEVDLAFRDAGRRVATILQRVAPERYSRLVAEYDEASAQGERRWSDALDSSDAVILTGGGYFTDAFAEHATHLLSTLEAALRRSVPVFIVGCGFEPVHDYSLQQIARDVLPRVSVIACREGTTSPGVLDSFGVNPERFSVTGDDAIELAFGLRPASLGTALGLSMRDHTYNRVNDTQYGALRDVIQRFSIEHGAQSCRLPSQTSHRAILTPSGDSFRQMKAFRAMMGRWTRPKP